MTVLLGRKLSKAHSGLALGFFFLFFSFLQSTLATVNIQVLPDKGQRLVKEVQDLEAALSALNISTTDTIEKGRANCFSPRTLQNVLLLQELGS